MSRSWAHVAYAQQVTVGPGQTERLRPLLKEIGAQRVLVLASERALADERGQQLLTGMGRTVGVTVFDQVGTTVPAASVQAATRSAITEQIDTIVSFGGGSVIDLGKAVTFFVEQQAGTPGTSFTDRPAVTHVAIPTLFTGAAGSTHFAMTDPTGRQVQVAASPTLAPRYVVWDPAGLAGLDRGLVAVTGLAALSHALDAAVAPRRSPESEAVALAAFGRVYGALWAAVEGDEEARASLQEAAALAARAWLQTVPGMAHGLAQILAGRSQVAYSAALSALVPVVLRYNADVIGSQLEQIGRQIMSEDLADTVSDLRAEVGGPTSLAEVGCSEEDLAAAARLSQANPFVRANPKPATEDDVRSLLELAWV
ncbi:MAG: iron-containing alcohol dehydrogenase [Acidimicrobiia bacterium]|nr:iron-containing alcohol dehydrogenase [Acidimicrobiia bacterium]